MECQMLNELQVGIRRTLALLCGLALASEGMAQEPGDVIRGRVLDQDKSPIAGVTVTATGVTSRVTKTATTNASGSYTFVFPDSEGDYLLSFRALGFIVIEARQVKRTADEDV